MQVIDVPEAREVPLSEHQLKVTTSKDQRRWGNYLALE